MPEEKMNKMTFGGKHERPLEVTVGPGQYDSIDLGKDSNHEAGIKYTMRGKSRDPKPDLVVGPGQYDIPEEKMNKMTFKGRHEQPIDRTVGPGQYDSIDFGINSNHEAGLKYTMRGKSRDPKPDIVVGPGHYEMPEEKMNKMTMGGKHDKPQEVTIGPGQYDSIDLGKNSNHEAGLKYTMRGKSRDPKPDLVVGPG